LKRRFAGTKGAWKRRSQKPPGNRALKNRLETTPKKRVSVLSMRLFQASFPGVF